MLMPAASVPEYFTLLPSEICRFVLGYLMHSGCANAAEALFCESVHLAELRTQYTSVYDLPFHVTQLTLLDIVNDYLKVANGVAHHVLKFGIVFRLGSVSTALPHILKTAATQPGLVRLAHIRPNRMPFGKACLPPRIVNLEQFSRNLQLPSLAVRPHSYSSASSANFAQCTSSTVSVQSKVSVKPLQKHVLRRFISAQTLGHPPRHITAVSATSELKGPDASDHEDDFDLQRFLSALLSNPERVATHINAKIGGHVRNDCDHFPLQNAMSNVPYSADGPLGSQITPSVSIPHSPAVSSESSGDYSRLPAPPDHLRNSPDSSEYPDHLTGWLERCNLDSCIDHVLSQFDLASHELSSPEVKTDPGTPAAQPEDVSSLVVPSVTSTPVVASLTGSADSLLDTVPETASNNTAKQATKTSKKGSRRRIASPLCLSQFTNNVAESASPPTKRRRSTSSKRKSTAQIPSPSVLHTPDMKAPGHSVPDQLSELESLQQSLFCSESTMKFYEEFVDVQESNSDPSTRACGAECNPSPPIPVVAEPVDRLSPLTQSTQPGHLQPLTLPTQPTVLPHVSALLPYASARDWPSSTSMSIQQSQPVSLCVSHPVYTAPAVTTTSTTAASTPLQSIIHLSTAQGNLPQTIILCPPNDSLPLRLVNWRATNPVLQSFDKPVIIRFPANTSGLDLSRIVLPMNVDLDSPNPYRNTLNTPVPCGSNNVENIPPLVVESGSQGKILNLASMDVDKILSKSLDAKR
ncbi:unnamed protein product [Dicrocoelium dendriticum]|nr:unnamed protein product [Dicrocoelium dendriticum]